MPRKLVVSQYVSLDGVIEDPVGMEGSGLGDWTGPVPARAGRRQIQDRRTVCQRCRAARSRHV